MATVGTHTTAAAAGGENTFSVPVPSGVGLTHYVLKIRCSQSVTVSWPTGFVEQDFDSETTLGSGWRVAVRTQDGSEGATFDGSLSNFYTWSGICVPILNAGSLVDADAAPGGAYVGFVSSGSLAGSSVTTGGAGRLILWLGGTQKPNGDTATVTITQPAGFTLHSTIDPFADHRAVTGIASATSSADVTGAYDGSFTLSPAVNVAALTTTLVFSDAGGGSAAPAAYHLQQMQD